MFDRFVGLADHGDQYLVATWPRYEAVIAALGPLTLVVFFGPIMALLLLIGAIVIVPQLFENVFDLADKGNEFLEDRVPGWEMAAEIASNIIAFVCILPAVPFVLGMAALGGLVEYLESKGKL